MDHEPPPTMRRKVAPSSIDQSVRASCAMAQNPLLKSIGSLVVAMATSMSMMSGTVASRVARPRRMSRPQPISKTPSKGAVNPGQGMPILTKRPAPNAAGKMNFWSPSERNTAPTTSRTSMVAAGAFVTSTFVTLLDGFTMTPTCLIQVCK